MADEIATPVSAPEVPSAAPVEQAPSPAPVGPDVTEAPASPEVPNTEVTPAEPVVTEAKKVETLLGDEKKSEEKPAESKAEEKPSEKKEADPEVVAPTYEAFKLPENVTVEPEKMGEFVKTLADFELNTKASHEEIQKLGQSLVDRHIAEMQRYTESLTQAWNKQKNDWKESFLKDPDFANRSQTVVNSAIDAIGVYGGDAKQQSEFRALMESSGIGNHPAMIRLLSNVMLAKAEPKPLAAPQISTPEQRSKISKMYGVKK